MADKPYTSPSKLSEQLVNLCWRIATELRAVYNTVQTRLTQSDADKLYLGINAKAASATTADSATKATQDASGNVISQTYAKNTSLPTTMTAATSSAAGKGGTVPAPAAGANAKFLRGDATWQAITVPTVDTALSTTSTNAVQNKAVANALAGKMAALPAYIEFNGVGSSAGYGGYIDFHYNGSTADYTSRIIEDASGKLSLTATNGVYVNGTKVATATDLSSYATTASLSNYALKSAIPTQTSQLTNNSGFVKVTSGTTDLTAGTSTLATGEVYLVYE